jgi:transcriptional regulator with XRE-family HTH domain
MSDFKLWLEQEANVRGWSHNELARQASLAQATVSNVLSGQRAPGCEFCIKIAAALNVSPVVVLIKAGILPPPSDDDIDLTEIMDAIRQLSPEVRQEVLEYVRFRLQQQRK